MAALTGLILYKKYKHTSAKYFIYFLVYLTIGDFLGSYTKYIKNNGFLSFLDGTLIERNYWWFTLFWCVFSVLFFVFYYNKILHTPKHKSIIKYCGYVFFVFSIGYISINLDQYFSTSIPTIRIFGALIICLCTFLYFLEILLSNIISKFYKSLDFYITISILVWWLVTTPLAFFEIYNSTSDWNFVFLKWQVYLFVNIFMYLTFTFALIWCRPQND